MSTSSNSPPVKPVTGEQDILSPPVDLMVAIVTSLLVLGGLFALGNFFYNTVALIGTSLILTYILLAPVNWVQKGIHKALEWARTSNTMGPCIGWIEATGIHPSPRLCAILVVYLGVVFLLIFGGTRLAPQLTRQMGAFGRDLPRYMIQAEEILLDWSEQILGPSTIREIFQLQTPNVAENLTENKSEHGQDTPQSSGQKAYTQSQTAQKQTSAYPPLATTSAATNQTAPTPDAATPASEESVKGLLSPEDKAPSITASEKAQIGQSVLKKALKPLSQFLTQAASLTVGSLLTVVLSTVQGLLMVLVGFLLVFYFLRDGQQMVSTALTLVPQRVKPHLNYLIHSTHQVMHAFIKGQVLLGLITGAYMAVVYTIFDVRYGLFLGAFFAISEILPVIGTWIGITPGIIVMLFSDDPWVTVPVWLCSYFWQTLKDNIIAPKVVGEVMGLHPLTVILALLVSAKLAGLVGILLALPVVSILNVTLKYLLARLGKSDSGDNAAMPPDGVAQEATP